MEENGKKSFFHPDHLGSTNIVTDESGAQVKYIEYKPYGETKLEEGSLKAHRKFTGKELDDSTGLYDYSARQYDAKLGRFITADPIDPDLSNPQSLNSSYTLNNPLEYMGLLRNAIFRVFWKIFPTGAFARFRQFGVFRNSPYIDPSGHSPLLLAAFYAYVVRVVSSLDFQQDIQQLSFDAQTGDVFGMAIDAISAAILGLSATAARAGSKAISGAVESLNKTKVGQTITKLPGKIADTFRGGKYTTKVLESDVKAYRVFGGKSTIEGASEGIFLSTKEYKTSKNAQKFLALPDTNTANKISEVTILKGTEVYTGETKSLFRQNTGGGTQIYIKDKKGLIFGNTKELK